MSLLRHALCLVLGAAVALASILAHRTAFPFGLLLALATSFAVPWWLVRSRHPRTATTYAVGWLAVLALGVAGRPEGDFVLAGDVRGYTLMAAGFVMVLVGIVSLTGGRGRSA